MKKLFTLAVLLTVSFTTLNASAQPPWARANGQNKRYDDRRDYRNDRRVYVAPHRVDYYYYPQANVYYNPSARSYYYMRNGGWVAERRLPRGMYVNEPYSQVYCNDNEAIWNYNRNHVQAYRPAQKVVIVEPQRRVNRRF